MSCSVRGIDGEYVAERYARSSAGQLRQECIRFTKIDKINLET